MSVDREVLVRSWLERADDALAEAELLAEAGRWNGCVNRLYYACFCAVSALLARHGQAASKHTGVRTLFSRDFVNTGTVPRQLGRFYSQLFASRQRGDYEGPFRFEESQVRPWLAEGRQFVRYLRNVLDGHDPAPRKEPTP
jgi:uncharacterized protein